MAGERTEEATGKRKSEAQKKGQYGKSQDLDAAIMLSVGFSLLFIFMPFIMDRLTFISTYTFSHLDPSQIDPQNFVSILMPYLKLLSEIVLPFLLILMTVGIIIVRYQVGHVFSLEKIKPDFTKLGPQKMVENAKNAFNIFSVKKIVELVKSFIKMIIVSLFVFNVVNSRKDEIFALLGADIQLSFVTISDILKDIVINVCLVMLVIGILDKKYQDYEFNKSIKMSKEEVKDERKNSDGDPKIKSKIRSIQFQYAQQRMMSAVPKADVVVTNPTHYAVALKYDQDKAVAPQVVAKGVDFIAHKIKEIAEFNNIPIVENKPLARTLYKIVPLEGFIPAELYVAVAEVLAYVYQTNKNRRPIR
ncbi:MAG: flagellar biosynthesis protein FlhB [Candidatus Gastranaerophilales bacterium]|nr:flagellar biosynthesis protein FlhB [Candidatus Gastranaerophilales bacterium]